jgi:hypothetical protein
MHEKNQKNTIIIEHIRFLLIIFASRKFVDWPPLFGRLRTTRCGRAHALCQQHTFIKKSMKAGVGNIPY